MPVNHSPNQNSVRATVVVRASRTVDDLVTGPVIDNVMIARTATATISATVAAGATVTIAATAETASPRVKTRLARSSSLPMLVQRTLVEIKTVSSQSVHGVDADVAVASVITIDRPMTKWRVRLRASQATKQPRRQQNHLVSRIDDGPLTSATRDDAEDNVRPWNQIPVQPV